MSNFSLCKFSLSIIDYHFYISNIKYCIIKGISIWNSLYICIKLCSKIIKIFICDIVR